MGFGIDVVYALAALAISAWGNYRYFRSEGLARGAWRVGTIAFWGLFVISIATGSSLRSANIAGTVLAAASLLGVFRFFRPSKVIAAEEEERVRRSLAPFVSRYRADPSDKTDGPKRGW